MNRAVRSFSWALRSVTMLAVCACCSALWGSGVPALRELPLPDGVTAAGMGLGYHRPVVSNGGRIGYLATPVGVLSATNQFNSFVYDGQSTSPVFPEVPSVPMPWDEFVCRLVGNAGVTTFGGIRFQWGNADGISLVWTDELGQVRASKLLNDHPMHSGLSPEDVTIAYAPEARLFFLNGGSYQAVPARLSEDGTEIVLGESLEELLEPSVHAMAISSDGRYLFYSSKKVPEGNPAGFVSSELLSLYRYDRLSGVRLFLAQSGGYEADPELTCSADGSVIAYVDSLDEGTGRIVSSQVTLQVIDAGNKVSEPKTISMWEGQKAVPVTEGTTELSRAPCGHPVVSADGTFVAFSARTMNFPGGGPASSEQIYRYDVSAGTLERISVGVSGACVAPGISPDGRLVAFVNKTGVETSGIILADCGPSLSLPKVSTGGRNGFDLDIATSARGQFMLSLSEETTLQGRFLDANGQELFLNQWYDVSLLPVSYVTDAVESFRLTVRVRDSETSVEQSGNMGVDVRIPWQLEPVSVTPSGHLPQVPLASYGNLSLSEDGQTVLFSTPVDLLGDLGDTNNLLAEKLFARRYRQGVGETVRLTGQKKALGEAVVSGDGKVAVYAYGKQVIRQPLDGTAKTSVDVAGKVTDLATDVSGQTVAWLEEGAVKRWEATEAQPKTICQSGASGLLLSRDGRLVAYVAGESLWVWSVGQESGVELVSGVADLALSGWSLSGHRVYYTSGQQLYGVVVETGAVPEPISEFAGGSSIRLSGNGLAALFAKDQEGVSQLFMRKLRKDSAADYLISSPDGVRPGNGELVQVIEPKMSVDSKVVAFGSLAANLVPDDSNSSQDLFRWTDLEFKAVKPSMTVPDAAGTEDEPLTITMLPVAESGANVELSLPQKTSVRGGTAVLLPPEVGQSSYRLQLMYPQNFCGKDSITLKASNGLDVADVSVGIDIENVNDAPTWTAGVYELAIQENEETSRTLSDKASDADLSNPAPYNTDALTFTAKAPEGVDLALDVQDGTLFIKAGFDAVTRLTDKQVLDIPLTVRDKAGLEATATLKLTVTNVNRAPERQVATMSMREDEGLQLGAAQFLDPDKDDVLSYVFDVQQGKLTDRHGTQIKALERVSGDRLPVSYQPAAGAVNSAQFMVKAVDESEAESEPLTVTVTLKRQVRNVATLWGGSEDGAGGVQWERLQEGWNLLSVPMALKGEDYQTFKSWLSAGAVWRWDGLNQRYEVATELQTGEGFWVFVQSLPQTLDFQMTGELGKPLDNWLGWQLISAECEDAEFSYDSKAGCLVRPDASGRSGLGAWRFVRP